MDPQNFPVAPSTHLNFFFMLLTCVSRFREYHVSYRKTSLGDSGVDSGSEHGSVVAAAAVVGQLSPTHIFHPEDNPLPLGRTCNNISSCNHKSPPTTSQGYARTCWTFEPVVFWIHICIPYRTGIMRIRIKFH